MPGRKLQAKRLEWNSEDNKDVVIVHMYPRSERIVNVSPFGLKLETWLRLHDIKYKPDHDCPSHHETSKSPWISYNGDEVTDSQLIVEFLTDKLGLAKEPVRPEDRVVSHGLRSILEDNLNFCRNTEMFVYGNPEDITILPTFFPVKAVNKFITKRVVKMIGNQPKAQGIGRLKKETVLKIAEDDLQTVSLALGDKPFVLGNEPSDIDAVVFGFLAHATYLGPANQEIPKLVAKFDNLVAHTQRIKDKYWPDWDELCEAAKKKEEEKAKEEAPKEEAEGKDENDGSDKKEEKAEEKKEEEEAKPE